MFLLVVQDVAAALFYSDGWNSFSFCTTSVWEGAKSMSLECGSCAHAQQAQPLHPHNKNILHALLVMKYWWVWTSVDKYTKFYKNIFFTNQLPNFEPCVYMCESYWVSLVIQAQAKMGGTVSHSYRSIW